MNRLRLGLYFATIAMVVVDFLGGLILLPVEIGYSIAFVVGTAMITFPLWGMHGILALVFYRHYTAREKILSTVAVLYMTMLIAVFFVVAEARNFP